MSNDDDVVHRPRCRVSAREAPCANMAVAAAPRRLWGLKMVVLMPAVAMAVMTVLAMASEVIALAGNRRWRSKKGLGWRCTRVRYSVNRARVQFMTERSRCLPDLSISLR